MFSSINATLYWSQLHSLGRKVYYILLYGCFNCHRIYSVSLHAMEAVIGYRKHGDQCHRYYLDFRHSRPRQQAQPRPKGSCTARLHSLLWLQHSLWTNPSLGVYRQFQHGFALSLQLIDTFPSTESICQPVAISHHASLIALLFLHLSCCQSRVTGSQCVQSKPEILVLLL